MSSFAPSRRRSLAAVSLAGVLPLVLAAGCGGQQSGDGRTPVVRVTEKDFALLAPKRVRAGDLVLRVANDGPGSHELIVVKAPSSGLPYRSDGLTVDEESLARDEPGVLEPDLPGSVRDLDVHLTPGRYVLLCNMSGHYLGGMHVVLTAV